MKIKPTLASIVLALLGTDHSTAGSAATKTIAALPGGINWVDYVQIPATNGLNTNQIITFNLRSGMAFIPAGVFTMGNSGGDPEINDADAVLVNVSAFFLDPNMVSYAQWQAVYNWAGNHGYGFAHAGVGKAANHPVQIVDGFDCLKWCNARSAHQGLRAVYYSDASLTRVGGAALCELGGQRLSVAVGSGMGKSNTWRISRSTFSVGHRDLLKFGKLRWRTRFVEL